MFKSSLSLTSVCSLLVLTACASVTPGDPATEARLKRFPVKQGMASLYVCRDGAPVSGPTPRTSVLVNDRSIGVLVPGTFAHGYFPPGAYRVQMHSDGLAAVSSPFLDVEVKSGQTLILWMGVTGGGWGTYTIDYFESEEQARSCVQWNSYVVEGAAKP